MLWKRTVKKEVLEVEWSAETGRECLFVVFLEQRSRSNFSTPSSRIESRKERKAKSQDWRRSLLKQFLMIEEFTWQ
jgi:hypothetical protein